jgi:hypothetical protein
MAKNCSEGLLVLKQLAWRDLEADIHDAIIAVMNCCITTKVAQSTSTCIVSQNILNINLHLTYSVQCRQWLTRASLLTILNAGKPIV